MMRATKSYDNSSNRPRNTTTWKALLPKDTADVKYLLDLELLKWGVQVKMNAEHAAFAKAAHKEALDGFQGTIGDRKWEELNTSIVVPKDLMEALHFLLEDKIRKKTKNGKELTTWKVEDLIEKKHEHQIRADNLFIGYSPYIVRRSSNLSLNGHYGMLEGVYVGSDDLDPLKRFSYPTLPYNKYIHEDWKKSSQEGRPNHIAKAAGIHKLIHGDIPCRCCNSTSEMEYNSNIDSSFCNVVCRNCGSLYKFWATRSTESARKRLEKGMALKKSSPFSSYCAERRHLKPDAKMFAIFLPTNEMFDESGMPAYVGEIVGAQPALNDCSFYPKKVRIICHVAMRIPVVKVTPWFFVRFPPQLDLLDLSAEVDNRYFEEVKP